MMSFSIQYEFRLTYEKSFTLGPATTWNLQGDFSDFIKAVENRTTYATFETTPKIMVNNGVISMIKNDGDVMVVDTVDTDRLLKALKKYTNAVMNSN